VEDRRGYLKTKRRWRVGVKVHGKFQEEKE